MIFYLMGKTASGKDAMYKRIINDIKNINPLVIYTSRPRRYEEVDGVEYYFRDKDFFNNKNLKIIEKRVYDTVEGPWIYATIDDGTIQNDKNYITIGTLVSYNQMKKYFGSENICPLYLDIDDETRRERAVKRENAQINPKYDEMERRLVADAKDFSDENIKNAGILKKFENYDFEKCFNEIKTEIEKHYNDK